MLHAIFPSIANVPNPFPKDVTMTGGRLIGFALAWVVVIGCAFIRPQKLSGLIMFKSGIMMICLIIFFAWYDFFDCRFNISTDSCLGRS
jgi:NCS1 family nucleobase:cation symporter-1